MVGMVIVGDDDGILCIFDGSIGKILWLVDIKFGVMMVNGVIVYGGVIVGGVVLIVYKGIVIVFLGYGFVLKLLGNVLLVYGVMK